MAPSRSGGLMVNLCLSTFGVELPTRSMRVQWPQYCGHVGELGQHLGGVAVGEASTAHISASCSESREACGWDGQSVRRSLNTGSM